MQRLLGIIGLAFEPFIEGLLGQRNDRNVIAPRFLKIGLGKIEDIFVHGGLISKRLKYLLGLGQTIAKSNKTTKKLAVVPHIFTRHGRFQSFDIKTQFISNG